VAQTLRIFPNKLAFLSLSLRRVSWEWKRERVRLSVYIAARQSLQSILSSPAPALIGLSELIGSKMQLRQPCARVGVWSYATTASSSALHLPSGSLTLSKFALRMESNITLALECTEQIQFKIKAIKSAVK
jgi:hypothetical protein